MHVDAIFPFYTSQEYKFGLIVEKNHLDCIKMILICCQHDFERENDLRAKPSESSWISITNITHLHSRTSLSGRKQIQQRGKMWIMIIFWYLIMVLILKCNKKHSSSKSQFLSVNLSQWEYDATLMGAEPSF